MSYLGKVKQFFGFQEEIEEETELFSRKTPHSTAPTKDSSLKPFKGSLIHSQTAKPFAASEIKVEEPRIYEDSLNISTQLRENKPVIINLKYLEASASKRLIDFVCGTAYAINGHMMKIGENIFLFTPANILIVNSEDKTNFEKGVEQEEKQVFFKKVSNL